MNPITIRFFSSRLERRLETCPLRGRRRRLHGRLHAARLRARPAQGSASASATTSHPAMATDSIVRDNPDQHRYEAYVGSELAGFATYHSQPGLITVLHTEIKRPLEGQGIGSELVRRMLDDIGAKGARVLPVCPFMLAFLRRHPQYNDLVWKP